MQASRSRSVKDTSLSLLSDPQLSVGLSVFGGADGDSAHVLLTLTLGAPGCVIAMVCDASETLSFSRQSFVFLGKK